MAKIKMKKCKWCGEKSPVETGVVYTYMTKQTTLKEQFFCSDECLDIFNNRKIDQKKVTILLMQILDMSTSGNIYLAKLLKPLHEYYGYNLIAKYLQDNQTNLELCLNKSFNTPNVKIKYLFAVIQNQLPKYKVMVDNAKVKEFVKVNEYEEDLVIKEPTPVSNTKRSINDILNGL